MLEVPMIRNFCMDKIPSNILGRLGGILLRFSIKSFNNWSNRYWNSIITQSRISLKFSRSILTLLIGPTLHHKPNQKKKLLDSLIISIKKLKSFKMISLRKMNHWLQLQILFKIQDQDCEIADWSKIMMVLIISKRNVKKLT